MIEVPYICIVRGESARDIEQQKKRWRDLRPNGLMTGQVLDLSRMTADEAAAAILAAMQAQRLERVAVDSLAGLAEDETGSAAVASQVLAAGARLFVVSYAVGGPKLVEVDRRLMQTILEYTGTIKPVHGDDLLLVAGYAKRTVGIDDLLYHLSALEESLRSIPNELPPERIAAEVRRIALLARVMQRQPVQTISAN